MKMNYWKFAVLAMAVVALSFTSCSDDGNGGGEDGDEVTLKGDVTSTVTLTANNTYYLDGEYIVKDGGVLRIEAGTKIIAKSEDQTIDFILVEQGGKIMAEGTAEKPIIMTSETEEPGAWGGLHICGRAPINAGNQKSEVGDAPYGGNIVNDNSGILRYVRIEYAGYKFTAEKECNGFTFYGVGNGTTLEYLQAYKGTDDGFEWFGGTVNAKYLVSYSNSDDAFDWTQGWVGKGQFFVAYQAPQSEFPLGCDCLIEADNWDKGFGATPIACPVLANMTLIGADSEISEGSDIATQNRGIRLRAGTQAKLYNTIVTGKTRNLTTETTETEGFLADGTSVLKYITMAGDINCKEGIYSSALFTAAANHNTINATPAFTNKYIGVIDGGEDMSAIDPFFTKAQYQGAVKAGNDWTAGWTKK